MYWRHERKNSHFVAYESWAKKTSIPSLDAAKNHEKTSKATCHYLWCLRHPFEKRNTPPKKLTWLNRKSPFLIGNISSSGGFSIVMLVLGGVAREIVGCTWRIIPVSKKIVTPLKQSTKRPFGRGTIPFHGLTNGLSPTYESWYDPPNRSAGDRSRKWPSGAVFQKFPEPRSKNPAGYFPLNPACLMTGSLLMDINGLS